LNFLHGFWKSPQTSNLTKILSVGAELYVADRQTDMKNLVVIFRKFAKTSDIVHSVV